MGLRTYLREKKNRALSKCIRLQDKVVSKFHQWKRTESKSEFHCFIDEAETGISKCTNDIETETTLRPGSYRDNCLMDSQEEKPKGFSLPDSSRLVTIIVMNGKITEKIYLTREGKKISLKGQSL